MRSVVVIQTGVGSSAPIPLDQYVPDFNVMLEAIVSGTVNATVEYSFTDPFQTAITAVWWPHSEMTAFTANAKGSLVNPTRAVRITVNSGTGSVRLTVVQGGTQ